MAVLRPNGVTQHLRHIAASSVLYFECAVSSCCIRCNIGLARIGRGSPSFKVRFSDDL